MNFFSRKTAPPPQTPATDAQQTLKEEVLSPSEPAPAGRKSAKILRRLTAKEKGAAISSAKLMSKGAFTIAVGLMLLMGVTFAASSMVSSQDAFIIRAQQPDGKDAAVISLSETKGFANPVMSLSVHSAAELDNISYAWLPLEELDAYDGSHSGEDYIAYSFYLKNAGASELHYSSALNITECTRRVDEAVRVMLYKNGEKTIYAREASDGTTERYPENIIDFCGEDTVMQDTAGNLLPEEYDRYTIVVWLEGEDPDCVDRIRGGALRMELVFEVLSSDGEQTENTVVI